MFHMLTIILAIISGIVIFLERAYGKRKAKNKKEEKEKKRQRKESLVIPLVTNSHDTLDETISKVRSNL